ncbi:MAG: hypothetical protein H7Y19_15460 [Luteimonas sp.]|nr:hypothetical protein [Luteimonas sp.]
MPSLNVGLDVRNSAASGGDGYTNTPATNGATYSYKYSGGSDGNGNANDAGEGVLTITVTVGTDPRYTINGVTFSGDIESQLSAPTPPAGATSIVITDSDAATGSGYFSINVNDTTANCTFVCDPRITNTPTVPPK